MSITATATTSADAGFERYQAAERIRELKERRCLMLDRPGWGLSARLDYSTVEYGTAVADLLHGVLDALEIDWADGTSSGDVGPRANGTAR